MKKGSWLSSACALALGGAALFGADRALAQECDSDADCEGGLVCVSYGTTDCPTIAVPDCPPGEDCIKPEPADIDCTPTEYKQCELPPCSDDSDCPSGTVCHAFTYEQCSGAEGRPAPACEPGANCPEPEPAPEPECETVTQEASCVPRYSLPCTEAADCGPGFTCEEEVIGWCNAGGASTPRPAMGTGGASGGGDSGGGSDDGAAPPEDLPAEQEQQEPECGEEATGVFYCKPVMVDCTDSADACPADWTCEENPDAVSCSGTAGGSADPGSSGFAPPDAGGSGGAGGGDDGADPAGDRAAPEEECMVEEDPGKTCMPPFADQGYGYATRGSAASDSGGGGPLSGNNAGGDSDESAMNPSDDGVTPPSTGSHEEGEEMEAPQAKACSVGAPGADRGDAAGLLALLGLGTALLVRRRRAA